MINNKITQQMLSDVKTDIAVIKSTLITIHEDNKTFKLLCAGYEKRFGDIEIDVATIKSEHSTMAKFQAVLSVVLSGVAAYLGVLLK